MADLNINGRNIDKTKTEIVLNVDGNTQDITQYVSGISYEESQNVEFGYNLSNRPHQVGYGNIEGSGTLTISDAGIQKINEFATGLTLRGENLESYFELGKFLDASKIVVTYASYDESEAIEDELQGVQFTNFNRGVNQDTNIYTREVSMMIGKIKKSN